MLVHNIDLSVQNVTGIRRRAKINLTSRQTFQKFIVMRALFLGLRVSGTYGQSDSNSFAICLNLDDV